MSSDIKFNNFLFFYNISIISIIDIPLRLEYSFDRVLNFLSTRTF